MHAAHAAVGERQSKAKVSHLSSLAACSDWPAAMRLQSSFSMGLRALHAAHAPRPRSSHSLELTLSWAKEVLLASSWVLKFRMRLCSSSPCEATSSSVSGLAPRALRCRRLQAENML